MKFSIIALFLAGCSTSAGIPIHTPNGKTGSVITCSNMSQCYSRPGRDCPSGYTVLAHEEANGHATMVIECKESE